MKRYQFKMIGDMENKITIGRREASISVSVFLFREGDTFIAYCPSLDLSGYDVTEDKAKRDFEFVLKEWLKEQLENGTLKRDLERHGWTSVRLGLQENGSLNC